MLWRKPHVAEMTAEARALYDEPEDAAAATILPVGAMAWDQVTEPPLRFAPWPYDNAELARIRKTLPEMSAAVAIEKALFAARWFLARNRLREIRNEPAKPDPHKELARIRDAADELLAVIKAASPQATRHLFDHPWPGAGSPPVRPGDLAYVVERFLHDSRLGPRALPASASAGPPEKLSEQRFVYMLSVAWKNAHPLSTTTRGWSSFRDACTEPLPRRFGLLGPRTRSERAWQTLLAEGERRYKSEANSPK
jgi:hypothetical protein